MTAQGSFAALLVRARTICAAAAASGADTVGPEVGLGPCSRREAAAAADRNSDRIGSRAVVIAEGWSVCSMRRACHNGRRSKHEFFAAKPVSRVFIVGRAARPSGRRYGRCVRSEDWFTRAVNLHHLDQQEQPARSASPGSALLCRRRAARLREQHRHGAQPTRTPSRPYKYDGRPYKSDARPKDRRNDIEDKCLRRFSEAIPR